MKRIAFGSIGVAAIAALALPSAVRTVSAAGTHICTVNTSPCPAGNLYGTDISPSDTWTGTLISTYATFASSLGDVRCASSSITGSSHSDGSSVSISSWSFSNGGTPPGPCPTTFVGNPTATIKVNGVPYSGAITKTSGTNWDATLTISNVDFTIPVSNGITCTATGSLTADWYNKGNSHAPVGGAGASYSEWDFPGDTLSGSGSFCPTSWTFTATYSITGNNPANTTLYATT